MRPQRLTFNFDSYEVEWAAPVGTVAYRREPPAQSCQWGNKDGDGGNHYNAWMNNWHPATKRILAEVERVSGKPIEVLSDSNLPLLASLQIARNSAPAHLLRYQPTDKPVDYLVCYEAGFVLRLFANPTEKRFDFASTQLGKESLHTLLTVGNSFAEADKEALPQFEEMLRHWALSNLRSLPIGMRIDEWLARSVPDLREQVVAGIVQQQQVNVAALAQDYGNLSVPAHLLGANAAYALLADRLLGSGAFSIPYAAAGALPYGERLLALWDKVPTDATFDTQLVDAWAAELGMSGWYEWVPFRP